MKFNFNFFIYRFMPESIAWEFNKNKYEKVIKKIRLIYRVNTGGKTLADDIEIYVPPTHQREETNKFFLLWKPFNMAIQTTCLALSW